MTSYARGIHRCETAPQWMRGVTRAANRQPIGLTVRPRVCETYILDGGWNVTPVVGSQGHKVRCAGPLLSAASRSYGDVSPVPRTAPRTPGASSMPARPYPGSGTPERCPSCRGRARPRARRLGSARGAWTLAAHSRDSTIPKNTSPCLCPRPQRQTLCAGVLCGFCAGNGLNPAEESKTTFRA
jgi:hypothetical protein